MSRHGQRRGRAGGGDVATWVGASPTRRRGCRDMGGSCACRRKACHDMPGDLLRKPRACREPCADYRPGSLSTTGSAGAGSAGASVGDLVDLLLLRPEPRLVQLACCRLAQLVGPFVQKVAQCELQVSYREIAQGHLRQRRGRPPPRRTGGREGEQRMAIGTRHDSGAVGNRVVRIARSNGAHNRRRRDRAVEPAIMAHFKAPTPRLSSFVIAILFTGCSPRWRRRCRARERGARDGRPGGPRRRPGNLGLYGYTLNNPVNLIGADAAQDFM